MYGMRVYSCTEKKEYPGDSIIAKESVLSQNASSHGDAQRRARRGVSRWLVRTTPAACGKKLPEEWP